MYVGVYNCIYIYIIYIYISYIYHIYISYIYIIYIYHIYIYHIYHIYIYRGGQLTYHDLPNVDRSACQKGNLMCEKTNSRSRNIEIIYPISTCYSPRWLGLTNPMAPSHWTNHSARFHLLQGWWKPPFQPSDPTCPPFQHSGGMPWASAASLGCRRCQLHQNGCLFQGLQNQ